MVEGSEVVKKFIVKKFIKADMHITPQALEVLREQLDFPAAVEEILTNLKKSGKRPPVVTEKLILQILESEESILPSSLPQETPEGQEPTRVEKPTRPKPVTREKPALIEKAEPRVPPEKVSKPALEEVESEVKVLQDVTGHSTTEGKIEDFVQLFRDRYERLRGILRQREGLQGAIQISNLSNYEGERVKLIGIVMGRRETRKGDARLIQLEDSTGRATIYVKDSKRNESLIEKIEEVVTDEVIGVEAQVPGSLRGDRRGPLVWGNDITWPDVPVSPSKISSSEEEPLEEPIHAALISDIHVGSKMFLEDAFKKFIRWLQGEAGTEEQKELASKVRYLIIAGDLIDGIGVYPRQQEELEIEDVYEQYEVVSDFLSQVPDHIKIIAIPGNHDAVRLAEPQPALSPEVAAPLEEIGVKLVSNPAYVSIRGVKFLIYHGGGFDDLIASISQLDREDTLKPMLMALKKRHLAPIYGKPMGGRTPIAPEEKDYLLIDEVPDVLHCGHLHVFSSGKYRGVTLINSATFQERTSYMKRLGVKPTPGIVPILNLKTKGVRPIHFA